MPSLEEAYEQIVDAAKDRIQARIDDETLDATAVVRGDREKPRPDPPYLWVVCERLDNTHQDMAIREVWTATLVTAAFIHSDDPETAYVEATKLAMQASGVVIASDRSLGLSFVRDVVRANALPSLPDFRTGQRFGALMRLEVRFLAET